MKSTRNWRPTYCGTWRGGWRGSARFTEATEWQAHVLAEAGGLQEHIRKTLKKYDAKTVQAVTAVYKEALEKNTANDNRIFKAATGQTVSAKNAQAMLPRRGRLERVDEQ